LSKGVEFLGWHFSQGLSSFPFSHVSRNTLRLYKRCLKRIIKNGIGKDLLLTINLLNNEIFKWLNIYFLSDHWSVTCLELDFFSYKLLWRFVKRLHPRRPNTWIYNKYWKRFSSSWRFVVFDSLKKKNIFLKSHKNFQTRFYRVPSSLNVFCLYNQRILLSFLFKKTKRYFLGTFRFLYCKQQGLCFICNKPFFFHNFKIVSSSFFSSRINKTNPSYKLILIHCYCL
jgi:RNA-directed DNA polymerase